MLRRSPMKRGKGFGPSVLRQVSREAEKDARRRALIASPGRAAVMGGQVTAKERTRALRNRRLLDLAHGRRCLLAVPGICTHDCATVVACHSNWSEHGKSAARKADDIYTVWGCAACHRWLDQGRAPAGLKRHVFDCGHANQVWWWSAIAADPSEKAADRRAAQWALDHLKNEQQPVSEKR